MSKFLGDLYEERVVQYLYQKGFKIIERNFHSKFGEIDIIATKKGKLLIIEVKGGKNFENLSYRVDCQKLKRIFLTFKRWIGLNPDYGDYEQVFLTALVGSKRISFRRIYLEDCFRLPGETF